MISRRTVLFGALVGAGLSGCTQGTTTIWVPWNPPAPVSVVPVPGLMDDFGRLIGLGELMVRRASDWKLADRQRRTAVWFVEAIQTHARVFNSGDPGRRQLGPAPTVTTSPPSHKTLRATQRELVSALDDAAAAHRVRALATDGLARLLWGSLAAFGTTMSSRISAGAAALGNDTVGNQPDPRAVDRAAVLARCHELVYGCEIALATSGLSDSERSRLQDRLTSWRSLRDRLIDRERVAAGTLPTPPLGYDLPVPRDRAAAWTVMATLESAMLPQLGGWLAGATAADAPLALDQLRSSSVASAAFGAPLLRWPGWPA